MYVSEGKTAQVSFVLAIAVLFLVGVAHFPMKTFAQFGGDKIAPELSGVTIIEITEDSATVIWKTDEESDSLVNYGLLDNYGFVRDPTPDRTEHTIILDKLDTSTTYHFRVVSTDEDGNQAISGDFKFTTEGLQDIEGLGEIETREEQAIVEQIIEKILQTVSQEAVEVVLEQLQARIEAVTDDLTIVGPPEVTVFTRRAIVQWDTDRGASSCVNFVEESNYNVISGDPYFFQHCSFDQNVTEHQVELIGLDPFTTYHFQVESTDELDFTGVSRDYTFTTKAEIPTIQNLHILKVEETAATLAWNTTIPAKALVEFEDLQTGEKRSIGNASFITDHTMRLPDLTLGTQYRAIVIAENAGGDRVFSDPLTFITVRDIEPPIISNVTNESTLFPGDEVRIQTIVTWQSDEPSICEFIYREGLAPGAESTVIPADDLENYLEKHVKVIVEFNPATVYKFWLECVDSAQNKARTEDFVLFTPTKEKSIIDIIIENFEATFGWVKNLGF